MFMFIDRSLITECNVGGKSESIESCRIVSNIGHLFVLQSVMVEEARCKSIIHQSVYGCLVYNGSPLIPFDPLRDKLFITFDGSMLDHL